MMLVTLFCTLELIPSAPIKRDIVTCVLLIKPLPPQLMTIIRFVLPSQDHMIKKLLLIFWEIVPKTSGDGKLLQEMILVCDAYRCALSSY